MAALQTARDHKQAGTKRWPWRCVVRRNKHTCPATATEITTTTTTSGVWGDGEADAACCCVVLCARAAARRHRVFIRNFWRHRRERDEAVALGNGVQHQQRHVKAALVHTRRAQAVMAAAGAAGLQSILTRLSTCVVRGRWRAIKSNIQLYQHRPTRLHASTRSPTHSPLTHSLTHQRHTRCRSRVWALLRQRTQMGTAAPARTPPERCVLGKGEFGQLQ